MSNLDQLINERLRVVRTDLLDIDTWVNNFTEREKLLILAGWSIWRKDIGLGKWFFIVWECDHE